MVKHFAGLFLCVMDVGMELVGVEEVVGVMDSLVVDSADVCMA